MIFTTPKRYQAVLTKKDELNEKVIKITLHCDEEIQFQAGQFISLKVSDKNFRSYSICSSPSNGHYIELLIAVGHEGLGSNYVRTLEINSLVEFIGPSGRFVLPDQLSQRLNFIATGTGIAPILSMLKALEEKHSTSEITLLFGVRDEHELFDLNELNEISSGLPHFVYKVCFSQNMPDNFLNGMVGRVTAHIDIDKSAQYFICGNPFMVQEVSSMLLTSGIDPTMIFHEKFTVAVKPL